MKEKWIIEYRVKPTPRPWKQLRWHKTEERAKETVRRLADGWLARDHEFRIRRSISKLPKVTTDG